MEVGGRTRWRHVRPRPVSAGGGDRARNGGRRAAIRPVRGLPLAPGVATILTRSAPLEAACGRTASMAPSIPRREFMAGAGATALVGALSGCALPPPCPSSPSQLVLLPLRLAPDRLSAITVCTRPFRARGPPLDL